MPKKRSAARRRAKCEEVRFKEVEFPRSVQPRLVIQFSDGLTLLVEDRSAIDLAGEFIASFRAHEKRKGGQR